MKYRQQFGGCSCLYLSVSLSLSVLGICLFAFQYSLCVHNNSSLTYLTPGFCYKEGQLAVPQSSLRDGTRGVLIHLLWFPGVL